jgi:beta-lactamase class A
VLEPRHPSRRAQRRPSQKPISPSAQAVASPSSEVIRRQPVKPRSGLQRVLLAVLGSKKAVSSRGLSRRERRQQQREGLTTNGPAAGTSPRSPGSPPARDRSIIPLDAARRHSSPQHSPSRFASSSPVQQNIQSSRTAAASRSTEHPIRRAPIDRSVARSVNRAVASNSPQPNAPTPIRRRSASHSVGKKPGQRQGVKEKSSRSFSMLAFVQGMRLVILGVGVWAIAGTILAMSNPQMRPEQSSYALTDESQQDSAYAQGLVPGAANSTATRFQISGQPMTDLLQQVTPITSGLPDLVPGIFVVDLDNGDYLSLNGESSFSAASMIKMPILVAFLQDVDAGKIRLDQQVTMLEGDIVGEAGEMQFDGAGTQYTALETAANMIITSDNTATNMIIRELGGIEVLNQRFRSWGLQQTVLRNLLPDLEGTNETSARELSHLIARVSEGELLSMKSRDRFMDIMQRTLANGLLPATLGQGATIAHKTGDIGSLLGDTGLVDMPNGKRYAITVMVKRPHNDDRAFELIRQISGVTYEYLNQRPNQLPATSNPIEPSNSQTQPSNIGPSLPSDGSFAGDRP